MITFEELVYKLSEGELAVFIGAGVSRTYDGKPGVPIASEMIDYFARRFSYIAALPEYKSQSLAFEKACQMIREESGDRELIDALCKQIKNPIIRPLPAHDLLAKLPFNAYFTTNFDTLLETACSRVCTFHKIVVDSDVATWHTKDSPIIKLHGCIDNTNTIVAAVDDYRPFNETKPLIASLAKTILSCKTILFLGFSLNDTDFKDLFEELHNILGDKYMGKHVAIVKQLDKTDEETWEKDNVTYINTDLTSFLNRLALGLNDLFEIASSKEQLKSPYLKRLHEVTSCPTETIATDVFLRILSEELNSSQPVESIITDFQKASEMVYNLKPNFSAFNEECQEIEKSLLSMNNRQDMIYYLEDIEAERSSRGRKINKHSASIIKSSNQILFYSQSIRALDFMKSISRDIQESCTLYICECRTKSATPFYDAKQVCEYLHDSGYQKHIVTDSSVSYLFNTNQVQLVLMGAHTVFVDDKNKMVCFVNTAGSNSIIHEAERNNIPVYVIAEKKKIRKYSEEAIKEVNYKEGAIITKALGDCSANPIEITYDLCQRCSNTIFVCEDGKDA